MSLISEQNYASNNRTFFEAPPADNKRSDYEKRLQEVQLERSSYDKSIGFRTAEVINKIPGSDNSQIQIQTQPQPQTQTQTQFIQKIHPSIIAMFLKMDAPKREILKQTQLQLYQSIITELGNNANNAVSVSLETTQQIMNNINENAGSYGTINDFNDSNDSICNNEICKNIMNIDFRNDLFDCKDYVYSININKPTPKYNVIKLELNSITINQCYNLEHEPYIYLSIAGIKGNHENGIFGKLILKKIVNGFMIYTPENAYKQFAVPTTLDHFDFAFLNHQYKKIILNRIPIVKIKKTESLIIITSASKHYLSVDDKINIFKIEPSGNNCCYTFIILETDGNNFTVAMPKDGHILKGTPDLVFEKINIKLTMSFSYESIL
jgi:hypothetical protein